MKPKLIIVIVLSLAGLGLGAMNWASYMKNRPGAARPEIATPARKNNDPRPAATASPLTAPAEKKVETQAQVDNRPKEFKLDAAPGTASGDNGGNVRVAQLEEKNFFWPDTSGRNPFLNQQEIEQLARGEIIEEQEQQTPANVGIMLPDVSISGMIRDSRTGKYRAIIEGKTRSVGDRVGVETITAITQNSVELEYSGRTRVITLAGVVKPDTGAVSGNDIIMKELP